MAAPFTVLEAPADIDLLRAGRDSIYVEAEGALYCWPEHAGSELDMTKPLADVTGCCWAVNYEGQIVVLREDRVDLISDETVSSCAIEPPGTVLDAVSAPTTPELLLAVSRPVDPDIETTEILVLNADYEFGATGIQFPGSAQLASFKSGYLVLECDNERMWLLRNEQQAAIPLHCDQAVQLSARSDGAWLLLLYLDEEEEEEVTSLGVAACSNSPITWRDIRPRERIVERAIWSGDRLVMTGSRKGQPCLWHQNFSGSSTVSVPLPFGWSTENLVVSVDERTIYATSGPMLARWGPL